MMLAAGGLMLSASPCTKRMGGVACVKYEPPSGGHSAPASTMAAVTARPRQQGLAASAATVPPPSDYPAAAVLLAATRPARKPRDWPITPRSLRLTYDHAAA